MRITSLRVWWEGGSSSLTRVQVFVSVAFLGQRRLCVCSFERIVHMELTPVEMQSFATVRSVVLWAQLEGDPLQALLNIWVWKSMLTHEFLSFWKSLGRCNREVVRSCQPCDAGSKSQNGGGQGGSSLDNHLPTCW